MKKILMIAAATVAMATNAQTVDNWKSTSGEVWKNTSGQCWRDASWTPATAAPGCDGELVKTVAIPAVQAPVVQKQARAPVQNDNKPLAVAIAYSNQVHFAFDKSVLTPEGKAMLNELIQQLKIVRLEVMVLVGHTDSIGTEKYNQKLSERRAMAVKSYLISNGVEQSRIFIEGRGETDPVADNKTATGRALNRWVDVELLGAVVLK